MDIWSNCLGRTPEASTIWKAQLTCLRKSDVSYSLRDPLFWPKKQKRDPLFNGIGLCAKQVGQLFSSWDSDQSVPFTRWFVTVDQKKKRWFVTVDKRTMEFFCQRKKDGLWPDPWDEENWLVIYLGQSKHYRRSKRSWT